jgi:eukaryotic-like serine/threonine-protein kinase
VRVFPGRDGEIVMQAGDEHPSTAGVATPPEADLKAQHFRRVMAVFEKAVGVEGAARERLLIEECGGDGAIRAEVEAMLGHAAEPAAGITAGGGLAPGVAGRIIGKASMESASRALMPLLKGEYRILGALGHGGMGVVYKAEQTIPKRVVAIKAIRPGLTSRQVLRRFEHEAHILGRLQHPGIAQVYEAGAASSARADEAFFVMEFVDGTPITDFAREAALGVREKLEIVARVCDAVQHAHQRRVIHRDLKPGNILVTGDGQPKILDFGVARLDGSDDTESITRQTHAGQLIGTLAYMAPEQLEGAEVDARADVYALGVLLYQLLTGKLPHDFKGSSLLEAARLIRQDEPARVTRVDPSLKGDIDIIVQKAAERDRERRYQSAADLAADIRRHLKDEPIQARADSAVYVIRKQLARHKGVTAAIVAAVLALAGFAVYASVQSSREAAAKERADANAERYRAELAVTNIERGRLLGMTGNFAVADRLLWDEHTAAPSDLSYWALWEMYSRMPTVATLGDHPREVRYVAAGADGATAATCSLNEVHLWDAHTWRCTGVVSLDTELRGLEYSPDGAYVLAAGDSGQVWVIRAASGEKACEVKVPGAMGIAIAPVGPAPWPVGVVSGNSVVRFYQLGSDGELREDGEFRPARPWVLPPHAPIAINPARTLMAAGSFDGEVHAWRMDTREEVWRTREHPGTVGSLAFSPDGTLLVTGGNDRVMFFYDVDGLGITAAKQHSVTWDNGTVRSLAFSRDGKSLLASGYWWTEVWDVAGRVRSNEFGRCQERGSCGVWIENDSKILATGSANYAHVWEARPNGHLRRIAAHNDAVWSVALSPKGDLLASGGNDGAIRLWRWPSMEPAFDLLKQDGRIRIMTFTKDGRTLMTAGADGWLRLWDLESRHCRLAIENPGRSYREYYGAMFSADESEILTAVRDPLVRVYDAKTGEFKSVVEAITGPEGHVTTVLSDDGRVLASSHGRTLSLWSYPPTGPPRELTLSASGWHIGWLGPDRLAAGTWEGTIEVWDTRSGTLLRTLEGHNQVISSLALGPALKDGSRTLVTSCFDGTIKMWNPGTGSCLLTLSPGSGSVSTVIATPDGRTIISAHEDGTIGVWDLGHYDPHIASAAAFHQPKR